MTEANGRCLTRDLPARTVAPLFLARGRGEGLPDVNPLNPKYRLMIATWKRLPLPVANAIGPWVARSLG